MCINWSKVDSFLKYILKHVRLYFIGLSDTRGYNIRYEYDSLQRLTDVIDGGIHGNGSKVLLHVKYDSWSRISRYNQFSVVRNICGTYCLLLYFTMIFLHFDTLLKCVMQLHCQLQQSCLSQACQKPKKVKWHVTSLINGNHWLLWYYSHSVTPKIKGKNR